MTLEKVRFREFVAIFAIRIDKISQSGLRTTSY